VGLGTGLLDTVTAFLSRGASGAQGWVQGVIKGLLGRERSSLPLVAWGFRYHDSRLGDQE